MGQVRHTTGGEVPRLRLDELLLELESRIEAVRGTRDRVHDLLEAVLSVGRELDLPQVLRRIVEAAVALVDAEYGALGVIGEDERLAQFLHVGVSTEQSAEIGALPSGDGILGELIRNPSPLRIANLTDHPASSGFPPGHPPMRSFLGVPIRVGDTVFGNLYLTEKRNAAAFDTEDETVLATLAMAAGVAIEKARLYDEAQRRERWLAASAEVTSSLLSGAPHARVLELVLERARTLADATLGLLVVPGGGAAQGAPAGAAGEGRARRTGSAEPPPAAELRTACASGAGSEAFAQVRFDDDGLVAAALRADTAVTSADPAHDPRPGGGTDSWSGTGPAVAVPMGAGDGVRGVLLLARAVGRAPFTAAETGPLRGFAGQAALAMELADRRRDAEQLALFADRDRIARDLHDLAIQRLFATGMTLQSAQRFVEHPGAAERLERAVDDLDDTIKIIRSTIFGLRTRPGERGATLRGRVTDATEAAVATLGFRPALVTEGPVDTAVQPPVADAVTAVLVEALSNVARHAGASAAEVRLTVAGDRLTLVVADDGVGMPRRGRRSGLRNLEDRAHAFDGTLTVGPGEEGGTVVTWVVPLTDGPLGEEGTGGIR
ncbi:GAF domain-containing protein [Streptomyces spiramenti]|uniref:GAF domain-containing protein n=1 Tax=Streptomyces spiramenti TaxID=2720606 RepID=A0ABX1AE74_9ACTN|nr:GAF domain-containing protein [Streptomyces spiramenti]NJP65444.1 GAF domain-containing protein [Streptomyces spiramenti]